jgi:DNA-binding transcriptional LysR family regulator
MKRSLASGGFTLISQLALEPEASAGLLTAVPLKDLRIERSLAAIRRRGARPRAGAASFWRWLDGV